MKKNYLFYLLLIFLLNCSDSSKEHPIIVITCNNNYECNSDMKCEAGYCVSKEITNSDTKFYIKIEPQNNSFDEYYFSEFLTEPIRTQRLKNYEENPFELVGIPKSKLFGEIKSEITVEYGIFLVSKQNNKINFYTRSYKENNKTYFSFTLPIGDYYMSVYPDSEYPPFNLDIDSISANNDKNTVITLSKEYFEQSHKKIYGILQYSNENQPFSLDNANIYAFTIDETGKEKIISNKVKSCNVSDDITCKKNGYFSLLVDNAYSDFYLKITSPLFENIDFTYQISNTSENIGNINLGNFSPKKNISFRLTGLSGNLNNIKVDITGSINQYTTYKNSFFISCSDCVDTSNVLQESDIAELFLFEGNYNFYVKPNNQSNYVSKLVNKTINSENNNIVIDLLGKILFKGSVLSLSELTFLDNISVKFKRKNIPYSFETLAFTDSTGSFEVLLEPGQYDVILLNNNDNSNYSNWIYFNEEYNINSDKNLKYYLPDGYKVLLEVKQNTNIPLKSATVSLNLVELKDFYNNKTGIPDEYVYFKTLSDEYGKFYIVVPILYKQ